MTELCKLAAKYGTDKIWYTPFYHLLFEHRRDYLTKKVLEIGIGSVSAMKHVPGYQPGASLRMWRDYFPDAQIFGVDKDTSVLFQEDRIKTSYCDQADANELLAIGQWTGGGLDLIVDDGSHDPLHQLWTARMLLSYLKPGGIYVIEDVNHFEAVSPFLKVPHACITYHTSLTARMIVIRP